MSSRTVKAPEKHEEYLDELKTTQDMYLEHDAWVRAQKEEEDRKRKRTVDMLAEKKERLLEEKERNDRRRQLIADKQKKEVEEKQQKIEKVKTAKKKWYVKALNVLMGWDE